MEVVLSDAKCGGIFFFKIKSPQWGEIILLRVRLTDDNNLFRNPSIALIAEY